MMRFLFERRPGVILLALLALGALVILSLSMRNIQFLDAQPIGREDSSPFSNTTEPLVLPVEDVPAQTQILVLVAFAILTVLVGFLLSPEARKRMLRILFRMGFTLWSLNFILNRYPEILSFFNFGLNGDPAAPPVNDALTDIPPPVFTPPQDSPVLSFFISLFIILAFLFFAWRLYRSWPSMREAVPLKDIAGIARSSLRDLSSGIESSDVIMNCYIRMSTVVADRRNLQRGVGMTPSEFARRLEEAGLPGDPVRRLTRLFESVRYGGRKSGPGDVNEAVACLTSILHYCGESA